MPDQALTNCVSSLSAVFILGGDIRPAEDPGHLGGLGYRSLEKLERDKTGPMPSYERVRAGAALYEMNPELVLIPSAGKSNLPDASHNAPNIASVMAAELRALGVPSRLIIEEAESFATENHFTNCSRIARQHGWNGSEVGFLSLFWHFGRIAAMMMRIQAANSVRIEPLGLGVTRFISVERVLLSADEEKWQKHFTELYDDREMIETLAKEAAGAGQLLTGHAPRYSRPYRGFRDPLAL